jgi:hypothetical protein
VAESLFENEGQVRFPAALLPGRFRAQQPINVHGNLRDKPDSSAVHLHLPDSKYIANRKKSDNSEIYLFYIYRILSGL